MSCGYSCGRCKTSPDVACRSLAEASEADLGARLGQSESHEEKDS